MNFCFNDFQKRALDLCLAINRLASLFSLESEILCGQIKELANSLTADILVVERVGGAMPLNLPASLVKSFFDELSISIVKDVDRLTAFLEIAMAQNREKIRPINFDILIREYQRLRSEMFSQAAATFQPARDSQTDGVGEVASRICEQVHEAPKIERRISFPIKKVYYQKPVNRPIVKKEISLRQKKLLGAIKKNREARMSDFLGVFKNEVTERTLRNDLKGLVGAGVVRSEGEFKTRRYYIS